MSGYSQRGGFTLTWNVENFAYSGMSKGERLKSPFFYAYSLEWCLMLYPRGKDDSNYIALEYYGGGDNFDFLYSILDSEGTPLIWKEVRYAVSGGKHINLIRRDEVFGPRKNTFLPNNTLTIQSRILKKGEAFSTPLLHYVRTRVQDNRIIIKWEILKFCSLIPHHSTTKSFPPFTQFGSFLKMNLCLDDAGTLKFTLKYSRGGSLDWAFATCKVKALDAIGKKIMFAESEFFFESANKVWQFPSYITKSMLMCDKNLFLPNDTLTLIVECTLSSGVEYSYMDDSPTTSTKPGADSVVSCSSTPSKTVDMLSHGNTNVHDPSNTLSRDLLRLYETGVLSDFNLSVGDATFPVHKQVLSARSPVFEAMFTADMKEKESRGSNIEDIDADTLQRMIKFIYTDELQENLEWREMSKLYAAADKYQLMLLRNRCAAFLKSSVCITNVCEILVLADMHQDADLKSTTLDFILQNDTQVIGTEPWKTLEKENAQLTFETFRALYLKKIGKK